MSDADTTQSQDKRIGIVIGTLEAGGAERMALALLKALLDQGHQVRLFCLGSDFSMSLPGSEQEQAQVRNAITLLGSGSADQSTLRKALAFPFLHRRLEREIKQARLELVISFMERANILNLLGNTKVPRIISIRKHLSMALKDKSPLKRSLVRIGYRVLLRRANNINFNAFEAAEDFQKLFPNNLAPISVINNFFAPEMLEQSQQSPGAEAETLLQGNSLLTCGRLVPVKGQRALIRAFSRAIKTLPDIRLVIVGDGPLNSELQQLIYKLNLEESVTLAGFQCNPYSWVKRCKLFVLPSRAEGFPNALLEAMGLGRPVIATDCHSGPRELLAPDSVYNQKTKHTEQVKYGLLTPSLQRQDYPAGAPLSTAEAALAEAIITMLRSPQLLDHYGKQAKVRAQDFTRDSVIKQWQGLIERHCS